MTITVSGSTITFSNGTTQTTAAVAPTTAQVLTATAGASVGAVGTYASLAKTTTGATAGSTAAGSSLRYGVSVQFGGEQCGSWFASSSTSNPLGGGTPAGTWRCMGYATSANQPTLWLRIS